MHGYLCKHLGIDSSTDHPDPVYEVPAIRINTTKSTYTFTSVIMMGKKIIIIYAISFFLSEPMDNAD